MPRTRTLAQVGYAVLAGVDTVLAAGPPRLRRARLVTKPLLMPTLAETVLGGRDDPAVRRLLVAQALSWGGDVALLGSGRRAFLTGLGSFFGAHLAYVSAYRTRSTGPVLATGRSRLAMGAGAGLAAGMALAARRRDPRLAGPVAAYGLVLTTMAVTSATVPEGERGRVMAGTSLFLLSDTLIGVGKFVLDRRSPVLEAAVMATYTAGQWCIADGIAAGAVSAPA
jgi:uncharacterized membrane protein YhhN